MPNKSHVLRENEAICLNVVTGNNFIKGKRDAHFNSSFKFAEE